MKKLSLILGGILIVIAIIVGAMYFKADSPPTETSISSVNNSVSDEEPQTTNEVAISGFDFQPKDIVVKKGETVTWTNQDTARHNVEFTTGSLAGQKGPLMDESETYSFTFEETGTFDYICTPHPYMQATVKVVE